MSQMEPSSDGQGDVTRAMWQMEYDAGLCSQAGRLELNPLFLSHA